MILVVIYNYQIPWAYIFKFGKLIYIYIINRNYQIGNLWCYDIIHNYYFLISKIQVSMVFFFLFSFFFFLFFYNLIVEKCRVVCRWNLESVYLVYRWDEGLIGLWVNCSLLPKFWVCSISPLNYKTKQSNTPTFSLKLTQIPLLHFISNGLSKKINK